MFLCEDHKQKDGYSGTPLYRTLNILEFSINQTKFLVRKRGFASFLNLCKPDPSLNRTIILVPVLSGIKGFLCNMFNFQGFLDSNKSYPVARVFPYGGWKIKAAGIRDVRSIKEARKVALQSIPDDTTKIKTEKELEIFVHSSYGTTPPRFPVLLFTGKNTRKKRQTDRQTNR